MNILQNLLTFLHNFFTNWIVWIITALAFIFDVFKYCQERKAKHKTAQKKLDPEAFKFLCKIPELGFPLELKMAWGTDKNTGLEFISEFQNKISETDFIPKKRKKTYLHFIELAKRFSEKYSQFEERKIIFNEIFIEAKKLADQVDSKTKIESLKLLWHAGLSLYWDYKISKIYDASLNPTKILFLIYHDANHNFNEDEIREIVENHQIIQNNHIWVSIDPTFHTSRAVIF